MRLLLEACLLVQGDTSRRETVLAAFREHWTRAAAVGPATPRGTENAEASSGDDALVDRCWDGGYLEFSTSPQRDGEVPPSRLARLLLASGSREALEVLFDLDEPVVNIDPEGAACRDRLQAALGDPTESIPVRAFAARALGDLGSARAASALPLLERALDDDDEILRVEAARALARLGGPSSSAREALVKVLSEEGRSSVLCRLRAFDALGELGRSAAPAAPAVAALLAAYSRVEQADGSGRELGIEEEFLRPLRLEAARCLIRLDPENPEARRVLVDFATGNHTLRAWQDSSRAALGLGQ
jgi:hypothetical protein